MLSSEYCESPRNANVDLTPNNILVRNNYSESPHHADPRGEIVHWMGYRTFDLLSHSPDTHKLFFDCLWSKIFKGVFVKKLNFSSESYFHLFTEEFVSDESWFHRDPSIFAGVLYLSKNPKPHSGTILEIDGSKVSIENRFNRLVIYNSAIRHSVEGTFGNSLETCRSTLNFFIHTLSLN